MLNRRTFLYYMGATNVLMRMPSLWAKDGVDINIFTSTIVYDASRGGKSHLLRYNLRKDKVDFFPSNLNIHELIWSKHHPDLIFTVPLWGHSDNGRVGIFSIKKKKFISHITQKNKYFQFSGHGHIDQTGKNLWIGMSQYDYTDVSDEPDRKPGIGYIAKVRLDDLQGDYELYETKGVEPQQILATKNGLISILHSGNNRGVLTGDSTISFFDPVTSKVVKMFTVGKRGFEGYGHMAELTDGSLILCGGMSDVKMKDISSWGFYSKVIRYFSNSKETVYLSKGKDGGAFNIFSDGDNFLFNYHHGVPYVSFGKRGNLQLKNIEAESDMGYVTAKDGLSSFGYNHTMNIVDERGVIKKVNIVDRNGQFGPHALFIPT